MAGSAPGCLLRPCIAANVRGYVCCVDLQCKLAYWLFPHLVEGSSPEALASVVICASLANGLGKAAMRAVCVCKQNVLRGKSSSYHCNGQTFQVGSLKISVLAKGSTFLSQWVQRMFMHWLCWHHKFIKLSPSFWWLLVWAVRLWKPSLFAVQKFVQKAWYSTCAALCLFTSADN